MSHCIAMCRWVEASGFWWRILGGLMFFSGVRPPPSWVCALTNFLYDTAALMDVSGSSE